MVLILNYKLDVIFIRRLLRLVSGSPSRILLTRTRTSSLVDIPSFISHSVTLCSIVEMAGEHSCQEASLTDQPGQRDLRWERQQREAVREKKRQWTIMCVAFGFFSSCLVLVGVMLSITSEYQVPAEHHHHPLIINYFLQDQAIARMLNMSIKTEDIMYWICVLLIFLIGFYSYSKINVFLNWSNLTDTEFDALYNFHHLNICDKVIVEWNLIKGIIKIVNWNFLQIINCIKSECFCINPQTSTITSSSDWCEVAVSWAM